MNSQKVVTVIVFLIWLLAGLYFGTAGLARATVEENLVLLESQKKALENEKLNEITEDGVTISNKYQLYVLEEIGSIERIFPWINGLSSFMWLLLTAFSFGMLGALISLLRNVVFKNESVEDLKIWSTPLLGLLTGLVVLGLSYLLPALLVKGGDAIRPISLMFICLFAGIFLDNFYTKITDNFNKIFK